jgi:demethylspheroidene O-methyltransferase
MFGPWHDRLRHWRNRLVADPKFQNWASHSLFTRFVARRQSLALFDLCAGFVYSQVLAACIQRQVFEAVASGPLTTDDFARKAGLDARGFEVLSKAAIALGLLERFSTGEIGLGMKGAALLGNPWIAKFILHHDALYDDLREPLDALEGRAANLKAYWSYARSDFGSATESDARAKNYSDLMAASQTAVSSEILRSYDFSPHNLLLDVGGGDGSFIRAVAAQYEQLRFQLFDLPTVVKLTHGDKRVALHGGDFRSDPFPEGADIITLLRVAHDHDDAVVKALFGKVHAALPQGGSFLLAEPMAGDKATARVAEAYFGVYFAAMGQGRPRTVDELSGMLRAAGFAEVFRKATSNPLITSVLIAKK